MKSTPLNDVSMLLETEDIPLAVIDANEGQLEGLPANPRTVKDGKFRKLMQSIKDRPDMLHLREIIVFPYKASGTRRFIVIGGNQRRAACLELGHEVIRCKVLRPDTSIDDLKAISVLDNVHAGEWDMDMLANEGWDTGDLHAWGMDIPKDWADDHHASTGDSSGDGSSDAGIEPPSLKVEIYFEDPDHFADARDKIIDLVNGYNGCKVVM